MQKHPMKYTVVVKVLFFALLSSATAQQSYIDSLHGQLRLTKEDTNRVKILNKLAFEYDLSKPDSAIILAQTAYALAQQLGYQKGEALSLNRIAGGYVTIGEYAKALRLYRQARTIGESIKDVEEIHRSLNNIGDMYMEQEDWPQALRYLMQARSLAPGRASPYAQSIEMQNIGRCYLHLHHLDSALWYERRALTLAQKADVGTEGDILRIIGEAELGKHHYGAALQYFRQCIFYNKMYRDTIGLSRTNLALGRYYKETKQNDSALSYTKAALRTAQSASYPKGILDASKQLVALYEGNDDGQALRYCKLAIAANDSLFGWKKAKQMALVDIEEEQRLRDIEVAKREERIKIKGYASLATAAVFLFLVVILYYNNRQKRRANTLLQQQKEKIQATLTELKAAQTRLIQKEKVASLGELTAGIAHEIQNPLNFINNFSEVNRELVTELKQVAAEGNLAEVKVIAEGIGENEQKIYQHGRRADAIVKCMLQHARSSTGEKQLTDLNALTDEYLRLSYQAVRAKDKTFEAQLQTHLDNRMGKVAVVPQDIGRVLLNLFNNAFYAVQEKKEQRNGTYQPTVSVSTRKTNGTVEIHVKDNGIGIPQKGLNKIFQPFFTTKPAGEGTGLGLSLSYDIVTKGYNGELKVDTKEGEYTEFVVSLPV